MGPAFLPRKVAGQAKAGQAKVKPREPVAITGHVPRQLPRPAPAHGRSVSNNGSLSTTRSAAIDGPKSCENAENGSMRDLAQCLLHILSPVYMELDTNESLHKIVNLDQEVHLSKLILHHRLIALLCPNLADMTAALRILEPLGFLTVSADGFKVTFHTISWKEEAPEHAAVFVEGVKPRCRDPLSVALHLQALLPTHTDVVILSVLPVSGPEKEEEISLSRRIESASSVFPGDRNVVLDGLDVLGRSHKRLRRQGMSAHQLLALERERRIGREAILLLGLRSLDDSATTATEMFQQMFPWSPLRQGCSGIEKTAGVKPSARPGGIRCLTFPSFQQLAAEYRMRQADQACRNQEAASVVNTALQLEPQQAAAASPDSAYPRGTILQASMLLSQMVGTEMLSRPDPLRLSIQKTLERTVGAGSVDYVALSEPEAGLTVVHIRCARSVHAVAVLEVLKRGAAEGLAVHGLGAAPTMLPLLNAHLLEDDEEKRYWEALPRKVVKAAVKRAEGVVVPRCAQRTR